MEVILALLTILGGILAVSALIIAHKPDAKQLLDKLTPFQALIGVGMIALAVINFVRMLGYLTDMFKLNLMFGLSIWCMLGTAVALGVLFGMPQILKWMPNPNAEQKAMELTQKIAPYQILLGLVAIASSVMFLLYRFNLIKLM
jgi:hypothetical protein